MNKKFPYGHDVNVYIDKAIEKLKFTYPWASRDIFDNRYVYSIEKVNNRYQYFYSYHYYNGDKKTLLKMNGEEFMQQIIFDQESKIQNYNKVKDVFVVPGQEGKSFAGWYLERYEFRTHELGGYSVFVQAGDRVTGGSRTFFIPPSFGFTKNELAAIPELKTFLNY